MSLLMDALRKAEQAKKQAEQDKNSAHSLADTAEQATDSPSESAIPDNQSVGASPSLSEKALTPNLSVTVDFETDGSNAPVSTAKVEEAAASKDSFNMSVEAVDLLSEPSADSSFASDVVTESVVSSSEPAAPMDDLESFLKDVESKSTLASTAESVEIELPLKPPSKVKDDEPVVSAATDSYASIQYTPQKSATKTPASTKQDSFVPQKNLPEQPVKRAQSISERTAKSRQSAKLVFAAKSLNGKNRKVFIYAGLASAAVLLLIIGYSVFLSVPAGNTFSIPEGDYLVSNESVSNVETRGDIEREPITTVVLDEPVAVADDVASLGVSSDIQGLGISTSDLEINEEQQNVEVGLSVTSSITTAMPASPPELNAEVLLVDQIQVLAEPAVAVTNGTSAPSTAQPPVTVPASSQQEGFNLEAELSSAVEESPSELITFRKKQSTSSVPPIVMDAYAAYQAGNLDRALGLYNEALENDATNIDALLGKAAITAAKGAIAEAMSLYSRVLALNPAQAIARTGLLNLVPAGNAADQEKGLRRLAEEFPNVAALAFALGNFYAGQSRWIEAQRYYFDALRIAKIDGSTGALISPDYAFNLAVSLDRLNQAGPAITYYEEAVVLASRSPANFDLEAARSRLNTLSGSRAP